MAQATGATVEKWTGPAYVYAGGATATDDVVFAEPGDLILSGARTLEGLDLIVDPSRSDWSTRRPCLREQRPAARQRERSRQISMR